MKTSAGILLYRRATNGFEVLLVHPGGPFWAKRDAGSWSAPKGEYAEGEEPLVAAKREFSEETGLTAPDVSYKSLGEQKQSSGKIVQLFAAEADLPLDTFHSNTFQMEWPPKSGQQQTFPECDRAAWVPLQSASQKLVKGQAVFIERLARQLGVDLAPPPQQTTLL